MKPIDKIRRFEDALDNTLAAAPSLKCRGPAALNLALNMLDVAYEQQPPAASWLRYGLNILAPRYALSTGTQEPEISAVAADLMFAGHYYNLRELLYYSYNSPTSIDWDFSGSRVRVRFADPSIPRQYFLVANRWLLDSHESFHDHAGAKKISRLLRDVTLQENTELSEELSGLIGEEVALKLKNYYTLLPEGTSISLGDYTYGQFLAVYKQLLGNALVHRYYGRIHGQSGAVQVNVDGYLDLLSAVSEVPTTQCAAILREITFNEDAAAEKLEAGYFSLFEMSPGRIAYAPSDLLLREGIVSLLRLVALRRPEIFLTNVSGPLGDSLTRRVARAFNDQGFLTRTNVELPDEMLPDIDVLAVSVERTLGYRIYICEVKNPLPPMWAKDHLRVLSSDGVLKAFEQLDKIMGFLRTERGSEFLRGILPEEGLPDFGQEFVVAMSTMVITSHNAGMFFADKNHPILDYKSLEHILGRSDGDVTYLDWAMRELSSVADKYAVVSPVDVEVGEYVAQYDSVSIGGVVDFAQHTYKSERVDEKIANEFVAAGHHPFDVLLDRHRATEDSS